MTSWQLGLLTFACGAAIYSLGVLGIYLLMRWEKRDTKRNRHVAWKWDDYEAHQPRHKDAA